MGKKSKYRLLSLATALSIILTGLGGASVISAAETESYGGGSGTELDPYIISSAEHMAQLDADTVAGNTDGKYYKLTADITLSGDFTIGQNRESKTSIASASGANSFVTDVKSFEGVFDGNFHTVTYTYSDCYAYGGLFSYLEGAEVKNLIVKGTSTGANLIFGSVAAVINNSIIDNCISEVEITEARKYTAGIAAIVQNSQITNTENRGCVVTRKDAAGGTDSDVSHVSINNHLKTLFSTKNENTVQGGHSNVGGIAAVVLGDVTFENVLNSGDVTNSADNGCVSHTGGIVGIIMNSKNGDDPGGTVIFNYVGNTGDITCGKTNRNNTNDRTGGIYGELENSYYHCNVVWNTGTITSLKSDGTNHNQTGSIGGATGGTCATIDVNNPHILYSKIGTVSGFTGNQCSVEFTGKGMHLPQEIYYEGDAYVPANNATKVDMKTDADFIEQLGSGWQAVEGDYPILRHTLFGSGSGTVSDPYLISSAEDIAQLDADTVAGNTDGKYYKLTADITLTGDFTIGQNRESKTSIASASGANSFVTDVKPFEGVFDGNFHTVTYTYSDCYAYGGLFSYLEGAEVKNLVVKGTSTGANLIFGSVAAVINNSVIDNCISEVEITDARKYTAGIAAIVQDSRITNTENRGCVVTRKDAAGATDSDVSHGSINNHLKTLFSTKNENTVQGGHSNVGGIAAVVLGDVTFENVLNSGDVTNSADNGVVSHTGGIVGIIMNLKNGNDPGGTVIFNYVGNTGDITCGKTNRNNTNDRTGGIYGELENSYYHCNVVWNTGTITSLKSDGTNHDQTGSIGGATGGTCATIDVNNPHILYSKIGTVSGFTGNQCSVEFTGKGMHLPQEIYYEGDAYVPANNATKVDMKTDADFIEQLGSGWQEVENGYPILRTQAKITSLSVTNPASGLSVELTPVFDPNVYEYTAKVANATDKAVISVQSATGSVSGAGEKSLIIGKNSFTVTVTAANGAERKYNITITRTNEIVNEDSTLKSLTVSGAELNEAFSADRTEYTVNAPWKLNKVTVSAEPNAATSEVTGAGEKELEIGENVFKITVISEGDTLTEYTLTITRAPQFKAGGTGTEEDPYLIGDAEDLRNMAIGSNDSAGVKYNGVYFKQTADIDLRGEQWTPICSSNNNPFAGHYDGGGFTIKNLKIDADDDNINSFETSQDIQAFGLFGVISASDTHTCSIRNVTVEASIISDLTQNRAAAGIVGCASSSYKATEVPVIENCVVKGSISARAHAAGILGTSDNASLKIINCRNYATVKLPTDTYTPNRDDTIRYAGGIAGGIFVHDQETVISGCVNYGDLTGYCYVGGILGRLSQSASSDRNNGITAENGYQATIEYCANYGDINLGTHDIKEKGNIGGIIGAITDGAHEVKHEAKVKLSNLYNAGTLTVMNYYDSYIGAVVGTHNLLGEIENCYNAGLISVSEERALTAGMIGVLALRDNGGQATMKNCYYWAQNGIDLEGVPVGFPGDQDGVVESVTWQQVSNGELAYMLDNGDSASRTYNWTMDTERGIPVFGSGEQAAIFKAAGGYTIGRNGALITATEPPALDNTDTGDGSDEENDPGAGDNTDAGNTSDTGNNNSNTDSTSNSGSGSNNSDGTAADNNSDLPGDSNSQNEEITYSLSIDKSKLDARLDVTNYRVILLREKVSIRELSEALVLKNATVAFYDAAGSEITDDSYILTEDTIMKLFNPDGEVIGTFSVVYSTSSTGGDSSGGISPLVIVLIVIAVVCVLGCVLGFVIYRRKKQSGK